MECPLYTEEVQSKQQEWRLSAGIERKYFPHSPVMYSHILGTDPDLSADERLVEHDLIWMLRG